MDYWLPIIVLFGAFFFMLALGVPIVYAIGLSTLASISTQLDFNSALSVVSQKLASGLGKVRISRSFLPKLTR
ncbi:hypothetical protein FGAF1267_40790 [Escherichia coli]|uniref:C4-dicarboxylate ABC transporter permease n=1 Tax=Escherichia coli TaxID=562 RepID=UPI002953D35F|nr:C4-dicarboxylate ABC transporter permease [Escherichia coli]CAK0706473.1 hypothetical protein FGAF637_40240 [Escherichia coli]CAK0727539.1 hypothetical protein FGAF1267_40790 [Escherichia coli]